MRIRDNSNPGIARKASQRTGNIVIYHYIKIIQLKFFRKHEEIETNEKINAIQLDIHQTEQIIDEIDKKMAEMNVRKKLINDPSQNSYYSEEGSLIEEDKRNDERMGSVFSKRDDRESSNLNVMNIKDLNNQNQEASVVYRETNEIIEQIKKKKGGPQDENVKKMDKSCDVCRIM